MQKNNIQPDPEKLQYIVDCLSTEELLAQLAEEASELAHAALKLRRVEDGTNPTPVPKEDAIKNILEEIADVSLVINLLGFNTDRNEVICREIMTQKADRWAQRLDWGSEG
jgi:NTP pyrophosphatase (non-canonical NTP hydrolase)